MNTGNTGTDPGRNSGTTVYLVRHGATSWSQTRRHTGRTDLPLTDEGRAEAAELRARLAGLDPIEVRSSPLTRARETAELAGFGAVVHIDERLVEWDYGTAEGRTTADIRQSIPGWSVWTHHIDGGEQLEDVAARADAVIADVDELGGPVLIFAHAHLMRILAARWCGLAPEAGAHFVLDPASTSVLGYERETRCVLRWNGAGS